MTESFVEHGNLSRKGRDLYKMFSPDVMLYWQNNWKLGMSICCGVVMVAYLGISLLILLRLRHKKEADVCMSAFVPVVNIVQYARYSHKFNKKVRALLKEEELSNLEDEEIEL